MTEHAERANPQRAILADALRYWEPRRILYNLALTAMAGAIVVKTWPHFRAAMSPTSIPPLAVLVLLANLCYCAAYAVEFSLQNSPLDASWRRWRWSLWLAGTLVALLIECYWILDEIYPAVPFTG